MSSSIERDVSIDKYHLDEEAKSLPSLIGKYHERIYDRTQELSVLEFDLEKEEAVARKHMRDLFTSEGRKFTVDMVNDEVSSMEAIQHLRREVADARAEIAYLKGVLVALDAKKSSINNLTSLYIKDYYMSKDDGSYREADLKHSFSKEYEDMAEMQMESVKRANIRR